MAPSQARVGSGFGLALIMATAPRPIFPSFMIGGQDAGKLKTAPYSPESNRDRWLVQRYGSIKNKAWGEDNSSNGPLAYNTVKAVFYEMETPEAVTAFVGSPSVASFRSENRLSGGKAECKVLS